jgi:DNA-binding NarL/FixJ family response regulator
MSNVRVVLADDHPVVRAGLAALLGSLEGIEVVGVAADGREAIREVVLQRPNVAVLDLQMPGQDGFAATREITRVAPAVAVLVLTMFDDDDSPTVLRRSCGRGTRGSDRDSSECALTAHHPAGAWGSSAHSAKDCYPQIGFWHAACGSGGRRVSSCDRA